METLKISTKLIKATIDDFGYWEDGKKKRCMHMPYFLLSSKGELQCYQLGRHTDPLELKEFIDQGRCYVFKRLSLDDVELTTEILEEQSSST